MVYVWTTEKKSAVFGKIVESLKNFFCRFPEKLRIFSHVHTCTIVPGTQQILNTNP